VGEVFFKRGTRNQEKGPWGGGEEDLRLGERRGLFKKKKGPWNGKICVSRVGQVGEGILGKPFPAKKGVGEPHL